MKQSGSEKGPKFGFISRKWHVSAVEFGEMRQISDCEISLLALSICSVLNTVPLGFTSSWNLRI